MWTPPSKCGPSARQPNALSDGLEMKVALEVGVDGYPGMHSPFSLPLFHLSTSTLHLSLVLALQSAPTRGAPLIEAPNDPRHCFLGQKSRGQGSRGPVHYIPAQPRLPCKVVQVGHCTRALPIGINIIDMANLYIYYDNFLVGGGKVS